MASYNFESRIDYDTLIIDIGYDDEIWGFGSQFVTSKKYSTVTYTAESAIEFLEFIAKSSGFRGDDGVFYPPVSGEVEPEIEAGEFDEGTDGVSGKLSELNESMLGVPDGAKPVEDAYLTDSEIQKNKVILQSSSIPENRIGDEDAQKIVNSMPNNHPALTDIKEKKKEVLYAVKQLGFKVAELTQGTAQLITETIAGFITIGSSAAIMPLGAGLPTAFSAVMSILSSLQAFQTKLNQLEPLLTPLKDLPTLVAPDSPALATVKTTLSSVDIALGAVTGLVSTVGGVKDSLGGTKIPGIGDTPAEAIETPVLVWGNETIVSPGTPVWISSNPKGGSWNYKYNWTSDNETEIMSNNNKSISVAPAITTKYTVAVSNADGKGVTSQGTWTVTVNETTGAQGGQRQLQLEEQLVQIIQPSVVKEEEKKEEEEIVDDTETGVIGAPGTDGSDGAPGTDGSDGSDGADGADGSITENIQPYKYDNDHNIPDVGSFVLDFNIYDSTIIRIDNENLDGDNTQMWFDSFSEYGYVDNYGELKIVDQDDYTLYTEYKISGITQHNDYIELTISLISSTMISNPSNEKIHYIVFTDMLEIIPKDIDNVEYLGIGNYLSDVTYQFVGANSKVKIHNLSETDTNISKGDILYNDSDNSISVAHGGNYKIIVNFDIEYVPPVNAADVVTFSFFVIDDDDVVFQKKCWSNDKVNFFDAMGTPNQYLGGKSTITILTSKNIDAGTHFSLYVSNDLGVYQIHVNRVEWFVEKMI
jgi:hypothetical protein